MGNSHNLMLFSGLASAELAPGHVFSRSDGAAKPYAYSNRVSRTAEITARLFASTATSALGSVRLRSVFSAEPDGWRRSQTVMPREYVPVVSMRAEVCRKLISSG